MKSEVNESDKNLFECFDAFLSFTDTIHLNGKNGVVHNDVIKLIEKGLGTRKSTEWLAISEINRFIHNCWHYIREPL